MHQNFESSLDEVEAEPADGTHAAATTAAVPGVAAGRLIIAMVALAVSALFLVAAFDMERGTLAQPGPGLGPVVFGTVSMAGAILAILDAIRDGAYRGRLGSFDWHLVAFIVVLLLAAAAMPVIGYVLTTAILATVVMLIIGDITWWKAILGGATIALVTSYVFTALFGVLLPTGRFFILGDWS